MERAVEDVLMASISPMNFIWYFQEGEGLSASCQKACVDELLSFVDEKEHCISIKAMSNTSLIQKAVKGVSQTKSQNGKCDH